MGHSLIYCYTDIYKDCQRPKHLRCPRDPDSQNPWLSARSWLTSSAPRRTRSSPGPRLSRDSGPTSRPTSFRTPRTSSTSPPTPRWFPFSERTRFVPSVWPSSSRLTWPTLTSKHLIIKHEKEEIVYTDANNVVSFHDNNKRDMSSHSLSFLPFPTQYKTIHI